MANNFEQRDASLPLVRLLMEVVEKVGVTTTKTILSQAARQCVGAEEKRKNALFAAVCEVMEVKQSELTAKVLYNRDEKIKWGITFACVLMNEKMGWTAVQIAPVFGMGEKNIHARMYEFQRLDKKSTLDSKRLEQYQKILKKLNKK